MEKIIFFEWLIDHIEKDYNKKLQINDFKETLWGTVHNKWTEKKLAEHFAFNERTDFTNALFNWKCGLLTYNQFDELNDKWNYFYSKNNLKLGINLFIFPENKPKKLKINFE